MVMQPKWKYSRDFLFLKEKQLFLLFDIIKIAELVFVKPRVTEMTGIPGRCSQVEYPLWEGEVAVLGSPVLVVSPCSARGESSPSLPGDPNPSELPALCSLSQGIAAFSG